MSVLSTATIEEKIGYVFTHKNFLDEVFRPSGSEQASQLAVFGARLINAYISYSMVEYEPISDERTKDFFLARAFVKIGIHESLVISVGDDLEIVYAMAFRILVGAIHTDAKDTEKSVEFMVKNLSLTSLPDRILSFLISDKKGALESKIKYRFSSPEWVYRIIRDKGDCPGLRLLGESVIDLVYQGKELKYCLDVGFHTDLKATFEVLVAAVLLDSSAMEGKRNHPFFVVSAKCLEWMRLMFDGETQALNLFRAPLVLPETAMIEAIIGYTFKDKRLLHDVFHHSSLPQHASLFESLEFIGDRVMGIVVASSVFSMVDPVSKLQGAFVAKTNNAFFASRFSELGLQKFVRCNPGASLPKVSADMLEALVGAVYLDSKSGGAFFSDEVSKFVSRMLGI